MAIKRYCQNCNKSFEVIEDWEDMNYCNDICKTSHQKGDKIGK